MICGASVATRAGVHLRCTLESHHQGGCDPYAQPSKMKLDELLRSCAYVLRGMGELGKQLAAEAESRGVMVDAFRRQAEHDRRRGLVLPLAWLRRLDNQLDPVADGVDWAVPQ